MQALIWLIIKMVLIDSKQVQINFIIKNDNLKKILNHYLSMGNN